MPLWGRAHKVVWLATVTWIPGSNPAEAVSYFLSQFLCPARVSRQWEFNFRFSGDYAWWNYFVLPLSITKHEYPLWNISEAKASIWYESGCNPSAGHEPSTSSHEAELLTIALPSTLKTSTTWRWCPFEAERHNSTMHSLQKTENWKYILVPVY